jgi:hypothetical protein
VAVLPIAGLDVAELITDQLARRGGAVEVAEHGQPSRQWAAGDPFLTLDLDRVVAQGVEIQPSDELGMEVNP